METIEECEGFIADSEELAEAYRGILHFGTMNPAIYRDWPLTLNLNTTTFPSFTIQDLRHNLKYPFMQEKKASSADIRLFVRDFLDGKVEPVTKSEAVPEM